MSEEDEARDIDEERVQESGDQMLAGFSELKEGISGALEAGLQPDLVLGGVVKAQQALLEVWVQEVDQDQLSQEIRKEAVFLDTALEHVDMSLTQSQAKGLLLNALLGSDDLSELSDEDDSSQK